MNLPLIACICLTADRQKLTERAIRCFRRQTYPNKSLVIFDTGAVPFQCPAELAMKEVVIVRSETRGWSIGALRNEANTLAQAADVIAHWDSDDYSAPLRLTMQWAQLISPAPLISPWPRNWQCTGYKEMLFWDEHRVLDRSRHPIQEYGPANEAWIYRHTGNNYAVGTSLMYWRTTWEQTPFDDLGLGESGEDYRFIKGMALLPKIGAACSVFPSFALTYLEPNPPACDYPLMIATVHGHNTCKRIIVPEATNTDGSPNWIRAAAWDDRIRKVLEAA